MALSDKKVLMVVPERDFNDEDYDRVKKVLESKGVKVTTGSSYIGEIRGVKGSSTRSMVDVAEVKYYDYDALVFVGGPGARRFMEHEKVVKLAKDAEYKVLGAIGIGAAILAKAELLKGKRATADRSVAGWMESRGTIFTGKPVEVDGKIVTAEGSKYVEQFGNALIENLQK
ncbi:MAG: DJ-1/PfpI family protein [Thermodesulfobacteriota bacterium]